MIPENHDPRKQLTMLKAELQGYQDVIKSHEWRSLREALQRHLCGAVQTLLGSPDEKTEADAKLTARAVQLLVNVFELQEDYLGRAVLAMEAQNAFNDERGYGLGEPLPHGDSFPEN